MKLDRWLEFFRQHDEKTMFSFSDIVQLIDEDKNSISVQLNRLVRSDVIKRVARGWYQNPFNPPSTEEIAMVIRYPSCLSMEYVLSKKDVLSQTVYTLTLVTTKPTYDYSYDGRDLEYHQVKKPLFFGYNKNGPILTAHVEKAFLDLLYIRCVKTNEMDMDGVLSITDDMYLDELNKKQLMDYSKEYPVKVRNILENIL
ncbi:MAG: hypothetical protein R6W73_01775 [Candidatus Saliniplasma sp.]